MVKWQMEVIPSLVNQVESTSVEEVVQEEEGWGWH
jgi:hypothetical protein